ncbi:MAG: LytTR family DNA-binding domain-containing protein [Ferruginibacter sp.]
MIHTININTSKGSKEILVSDIIRIEASNNYSRIFFANNLYPLLTSKVLHWFEDNLNDKNFIRSHKSHLINQEYIQTLCSNTSRVVLHNGETIAVSKRKFTEVKKILVSKHLLKGI